MRLEGKVALISGAAMGIKEEMMGIGGACARVFAKEGARLVLGDVNEAKGETTASQLRDEGHEAIFVRLDVTSEADWVTAVEAAIARFARLDVLVNCAGTVSPDSIEGTSIEAWKGQMDVHAKGTLFGIKQAVPEIVRTGGGSIVNISSIDAIVGGARGSAYSAAKGAIRLLTKQAAMQFVGQNIRVNSVHPGYTATPLNREAIDLLEDQGFPDTSIERVPLGRKAEPVEIAYAVLFLACSDSSFMTGSELVIDGGVTAQ